MPERRQRFRKSNPHATQVVHRDSGQTLGRLVNITTEGMLLITTQSFQKGEVYPVNVILPRRVADKQVLECEAEVRWCRPDGNPSYHAVGMQFMNLSHEDIKIIQEAFSKLNLVS